MPSKRILLVDDDPIFLTLAELVIKRENENVEIFKAFNGEEALDFLSDDEVDLIFLDLNMPIMDGWEFLEAVDKDDPIDSKVFILTSSIDPSDRQKALENKMVVEMLEKPLNKEKV
ncbi:MAG: response regulator, partial [Bacteroidota bacterium]